MKAVKIIAILVVVYAGIVVAFESLIGYFQPQNEGTLVLTTTDEDGVSGDRVLSRLDSNGQVYVAVNHWPRAWYRKALANPEVQVTLKDEPKPYLAVPATDEESTRVHSEHDPGIVFRILTGFPPRYFLRLDPR